MEKKITQEELDDLWDKLTLLAGGTLWSNLSKREFAIAKRIFNIKDTEILLLD
jgi:hypothetical protein